MGSDEFLAEDIVELQRSKAFGKGLGVNDGFGLFAPY